MHSIVTPFAEFEEKAARCELVCMNPIVRLCLSHLGSSFSTSQNIQ